MVAVGAANNVCSGVTPTNLLSLREINRVANEPSVVASDTKSVTAAAVAAEPAVGLTSSDLKVISQSTSTAFANNMRPEFKLRRRAESATDTISTSAAAPTPFCTIRAIDSLKAITFATSELNIIAEIPVSWVSDAIVTWVCSTVVGLMDGTLVGSPLGSPVGCPDGSPDG